MLKIGEKAPEFDLEAYHNGEIKHISNKDYKGKWIVLFFYPRDFTFVCPTELKGFAKAMKEFKKYNAVVISASTDSAYSHKAWLEKELPEVNSKGGKEGVAVVVFAKEEIDVGRI